MNKRHGGAKFSDSEIVEIKRMLKEGYTTKKIIDTFNKEDRTCNKVDVSNIRLKRHYKDIDYYD